MQVLDSHPRSVRVVDAGHRPHGHRAGHFAGHIAAAGRRLPTFHDRPTLLTTLAVLGVASGLVIAALLSRDPREAGAYAVACLMIGGAMAIGQRAHDAREGDAHDHAEAEAVTAASRIDPFAQAQQEVRAVAHDLKAPLLTVSSYLDLVAEGAFGPVSEEARQALRRAAEVSERAQGLVESTLRREAIEAAMRPGVVVTAVRVDLNRTLSDVMGALNGTMRDRSASVVVEGRLPAVMGDDTALFRVFENLVQNSIKYCPAGTTPRVGVRARRIDGTTIEVVVTDNGAGLPAGPALLLEHGVRGVNARGTAGHGLGLATVARLVARMHGTVTFTDAAEGGTSVRLTLPSA